jgi:hypothetical protein
MYLALAEAEWGVHGRPLKSNLMSPDTTSAAQLTVRSVFKRGGACLSTCAQEVGRAAVWIASSSTPALDDIHNS